MITIACDYRDKARNQCAEPPKWVVAMPHNHPPQHACRGHPAAILLMAHKHYSLTTRPSSP